jgi:hypothetical protein
MSLQFVHIPKTGGMSIQCTYKEQRWGSWFPHNKRCEASICHICHDHVIMKNAFQNKKTFCVVRNPYDRLFSEYRFLRLPDDICTMNTYIEKWALKVGMDKYYQDNHLRPQSEFAEWCDHVLCFDRLESDLNNLLLEYNIEPLPLKQCNKTPNYECTRIENLTKRNKLWVQWFYYDDFILYDSIKQNDNLRSSFA